MQTRLLRTHTFEVSKGACAQKNSNTEKNLDEAPRLNLVKFEFLDDFRPLVPIRIRTPLQI